MADGTTVPTDRPGRSLYAGLALVWLALVGLGAGYVFRIYAPRARAAALQTCQRDLDLQSAVRKDTLELWLAEGLADVAVIARFPSTQSAVEGAPTIAPHLDDILSTIARSYQYRDVFVLDASMRVVARSDEAGEPDAGCLEIARAALARRAPGVGFHALRSGAVAVAFAAPVGSTTAHVLAQGAVIAALDPTLWLYPFLAKQPGPSPSAEVLLVTRDGESVRYLSPLRLDPSPPLILRRPLTQLRLAAVGALEGPEGFGSYLDYRGVSVFASARRLDRAPWGLVVKVDEADALAQYRHDLRNAVLTWVAISLTLGALASTLVWAQQRAQEATLARARARMVADLEARVADRTAALESANRELEAFSSSVSHDLRAPVRSMDAFARILLEDYGGRLDDEGRRLLSVIVASARQMGQLIDDLLEFSRVGRCEPQRARVDMTTLARSVFAELAPDGGAPPIDIVVDMLPDAWGDSALLRQVWINLLSNAIKFTAPKVRRVIRVGSRTEGSRTWYFVRDNGIGFDPQYAGKLFGIFQRLHSTREFEGTGVGLALVRRIVHRHGGEVAAEGAIGEGATFSFSLPHQGASS